VDVRIDVRKSNGDAVDDRATQVTTTAGMDTSSATHVAEPRDPWSMGWLSKHRLGEPARLEVSGGSATASLPAIRWTFARASAPGWQSAPVEVEFSPPPAKTSVVVVMHPVVTLSGRVVSEDGAPIADALVRVHVLRKGTVGEVSTPLQPTAGMTVGVLPSGVARVTYIWETRTDAEGRYAMEIPERGEVSAYVLRAEHAVGRRVALDPTSAGDFTLRKKEPTSASVWVGGSPVPPGVFVFTDITDDDRKVPHQTAVSPDGTVDTTWLEEGRHYWLLVAGGRAGDHSSTYLTWDGRTEIELGGLETSFDDFWAGVRRSVK
jgi:hypothetical protein